MTTETQLDRLALEELGEPAVVDDTPWWRAPWFLVTVATSLVIVWATGRGIARGFEPIGDNGFLELRARDVLTRNHPWLGTWSSASMSSGQDLNHPGPLLFDLFAVPVRLFGSRWGVAGGAALINLAAIWSSVLVAKRLGGPLTALATSVAAGGLVWSLGSELLYDVWGPNILVLPAFAFLVMVWAVAGGHPQALPPAVFIGSLCAQTHASYLLFAPLILLAGIIALLVWHRHRPATMPMIGLAVGVGLLAWAQPLWEQFFGDGEGNLSRLASSTDGGSDRVGLSLGLRLFANVVTIPPGWLRNGYDTSIPLNVWIGEGDDRQLPTDGIAGLPFALITLVVAIAVAAALVWWTRRSGDERAWTTTTAGVAMLAVIAVVALVTTVINPIDGFGITAHKFRYLFAVGALFGAVVMSGVLHGLTSTRLDRRVAPTVMLGIGVMVATMTFPTSRAAAGPVLQHATWDTVRDLRDQLGPVVTDVGTIWFDLENQVFSEPYSSPIMAELAARGVDFRVTSSGDIRQVGNRRAFDAFEVDTRLFYVQGAGADVAPAGAERIASAGSGTPDDPFVAVFIEPFDAADSGG